MAFENVEGGGQHRKLRFKASLDTTSFLNFSQTSLWNQTQTRLCRSLDSLSPSKTQIRFFQSLYSKKSSLFSLLLGVWLVSPLSLLADDTSLAETSPSNDNGLDKSKPAGEQCLNGSDGCFEGQFSNLFLGGAFQYGGLVAESLKDGKSHGNLQYWGDLLGVSKDVTASGVDWAFYTSGYGGTTNAKVNLKNVGIAIFGLYTIDGTFNFNGAYRYDMDSSLQAFFDRNGYAFPSLKGYAFRGDIAFSNGNATMQFNSITESDGSLYGANMQGNITNYNSTATLSFQNSSLESDSITSALPTGSTRPATTLSFEGNSQKGFALKGTKGNSADIKVLGGADFTLKLDKGAIAYASILADPKPLESPDKSPKVTLIAQNGSEFHGTLNAGIDANIFFAENHPEISAKFSSGSKFYGNINANRYKGTINLNFDGEGSAFIGDITSVDLYSRDGIITGFHNGTIINGAFKNSASFSGRFDNAAGNIWNWTLEGVKMNAIGGIRVGDNGSGLNLSAKNSQIIGGIYGYTTGYYLESGSTDIEMENSTIIGDVAMDKGVSTMFILTNSTITGTVGRGTFYAGNGSFGSFIGGVVLNDGYTDINQPAGGGDDNKKYRDAIGKYHLGFIDVTGGKANIDLGFGSTLTAGIRVAGGIANTSIYSDVRVPSSVASSDSSRSQLIDFDKANFILANNTELAKQLGLTSTPDAAGKVTFTQEEIDTIFKDFKSNPVHLQNYLSDANISSLAGDIFTSGGQNNLYFDGGLFLGDKISTSGSGVTNLTMWFDPAKDVFVDRLKQNPVTKDLFGKSINNRVFTINTLGENAINNLAFTGEFNITPIINYMGGETNIVMATNFSAISRSDFKKQAGKSSNLNDTSTINPLSTTPFLMNGFSYTGGVLIRPNASKANKILANYRSVFPNNQVRINLDSSRNASKFSYINFKGVMVGDITPLPFEITKGVDKDNKPQPFGYTTGGVSPIGYQLVLEKNSAFIGSIYMDSDSSIKDSKGVEKKPIESFNVAINQGGKLILENNAHIDNLLGVTYHYNQEDALKDSLLQSNTIIDITNALNMPLINPSKQTYHKLTLDNVQNLSNAIFRVSYNPNVNATDAPADGAPASDIDLARSKTNDWIEIKNTATTSSQTIFNNILQAFQNTLNPVLGDLRDKKILVASVTDDGTHHFNFADSSSVTQGYDVITTTFDKVQDTAKNTTHYYIGSVNASIDKASQDISQSALSTNYTMFLSNINDLNKRLGELRNNPYSQGSWLRIFNGMSSSARNEAFKTYSTNVQVGYDYALDNSGNESKHYLGVAFSYGYNKIDGSSLTGRANLFEVGTYYSYVSNAGFYNDTILKYALIDNELSLSNHQAQGISLNTSNVSLGEEFGYRWDFLLKENNSIHHRLYLEPQAELILGYLSNGSISQVNGNAYLNSNLESILAFRGRIGGVIGYSLKAFKNQTDFRVGLSYVGDLVGGGKINLKSNFSSAEGKIESNQMGMVSVGVNSMVTDSLRLYLDVDTSFGGTYFNQDYLVSVGGRYSFGKKNSSFAKGVQAKQKEDKAKLDKAKQDKAKEKALKDKQAKEAKAAQALKAKQEKAAKAKSSSKAQPTKAQPAKAQPSKAQSNKAQPSKSQSNKGGK